MNSHRVETIDDLLVEILIRLPPKSIFRFISVSKRWKNIINHPFFLQCHSRRRRRRLSASEGGAGGPIISVSQERPFPITTRNTPRNLILISKLVPKELGILLNSSNGLVLCRRSSSTYTVFNPVTGSRLHLTPPPSINFISVGFMCEENASQLVASFTFVALHLAPRDSLKRQIETYSSKTGQWARSKLVATGVFNYPCRDTAAVANGIFHWIADSGGRLVVYDPSDGRNRLQVILLPPIGDHNYYGIVTRSKDDDDDDILWYARNFDNTCMKFWAMRKLGEKVMRHNNTSIDAEEWALAYNIIIDSMFKSVQIDNYTRPMIYLIGFISGDPLTVVVRYSEGWFAYNLEAKSHHFAVRYDTGAHLPSVCPFFESSTSLSSYVL